MICLRLLLLAWVGENLRSPRSLLEWRFLAEVKGRMILRFFAFEARGSSLSVNYIIEFY